MPDVNIFHGFIITGRSDGIPEMEYHGYKQDKNTVYKYGYAG